MNRKELIAIAEYIGSFSRDPLGFVRACFPWGEGALANRRIEQWQIDLLTDIRDGLKTPDEVIRTAIASGHGVGKSCLGSWLILWAISTRENTRGVITANTDGQLKSKTMPELQKWYNRFIGKELFVCTATAIFSAEKEYEKTWRIDAIPWSENNPEAFAGLHNQGSRILFIFDEASAIPPIIWEVAQGAMTDANTEKIWAVFGNPTRNTGRFFDCFHKERKYWYTRQIDSRTVSFTDKEELNKEIVLNGLDSDVVKVRILGQFPSASELQFIPRYMVDMARGKHLQSQQYSFAPVIIGVDPAWTGGDEIAIVKRQGLACWILATYKKNDNDYELASRIATFEDEHKADAVFIDMGYGTGVYSAGKVMGRSWQLVNFGNKSPDAGFYNLRAYGWGKMKQWLQEGGAIPDNQQLCDDLIAPETKPRDDGKIQLESKDNMKKRGLPSPNLADALAITFMRPVIKQDARQPQWANNTPYNIFGYAEGE